MVEVRLEVDGLKVDLFMNWLRIVGSLLLIIGRAENPFKVKGKCRTIEMKLKQIVVSQLNSKECS